LDIDNRASENSFWLKMLIRRISHVLAEEVLFFSINGKTRYFARDRIFDYKGSEPTDEDVLYL